MTWIKICGTTSLDDAKLAVAAGADALGFIFAKSPRRIDPAVARAIIEELPQTVEKVGVFVNETPARMHEIIDFTGLTAVQLQGEETSQAIEELRKLCSNRRPLRVLKALGVANDVESVLSDFTAAAA